MIHTESKTVYAVPLNNYLLQSEPGRGNGYLLSFWSVSVLACHIHKQSVSSVLKQQTAGRSNMEQTLAVVDFLRDPLPVFNTTLSQGTLRVLNFQGTFQGHSSSPYAWTSDTDPALDTMLLYTEMSCLPDP